MLPPKVFGWARIADKSGGSDGRGNDAHKKASWVLTPTPDLASSSYNLALILPSPVASPRAPTRTPSTPYLQASSVKSLPSITPVSRISFVSTRTLLALSCLR